MSVIDTHPATDSAAHGGCAAAVCSPLKVLVACEYSGTVRDSFLALGHEAMSCDLLPTDAEGPHYQGDVRDLLEYPWDLMIAHPPCTHLSVSGARHFAEKRKDGRQQSAASFFLMLARAPIERIAIENPVCIMSSLWRKPDQVIQPWQFGHGETKATCLWLKNLPPLQSTSIVEGRENRIHRMPPSPDRWKERSKTYAGIAAAMAAQWGGFISANTERMDG
jgi:site-specific DNA-cytosine methylase